MIQLDPSTDHDRAPDFEGLIQRVGQRFIDGEGTVITIAEFLNCGPKMRWSGRKPDGTDRIYDDAGKNLSGDELPQWNLVGPAPDSEEREQLKRHNAELIAENKALKRRSPLSQEEFDKIASDARWIVSADDVREAVRATALREIDALLRGEPVYLVVDLPEREATGIPWGVMHDVEAVRIDAPDGEGFLYEIREKSFG